MLALPCIHSDWKLLFIVSRILHFSFLITFFFIFTADFTIFPINYSYLSDGMEFRVVCNSNAFNKESCPLVNIYLTEALQFNKFGTIIICDANVLDTKNSRTVLESYLAVNNL